MKIIIPSYKRANNVFTKKIFPEAIVVVPESQKEEYEKNYSNVVAIPDERDGSVAKKRNAVLDLFNEDVFMVDDDISGFLDLRTDAEIDAEIMMKYVDNGFEMARDMGAGMFGFNISKDKMKFKNFSPFSLTKQVYYAVGILKDEIRYDEELNVAEDVDFFSNKLHKYHRVLRFNFIYPQQAKRKGGGVDYSIDQLPFYEKLQRRWGSNIIEIKDKKKMKIGVHSPIMGV